MSFTFLDDSRKSVLEDLLSSSTFFLDVRHLTFKKKSKLHFQWFKLFIQFLKTFCRHFVYTTYFYYVY